MAAVSKHGELKQSHVSDRWKIGWFLEIIGKYAVDFSVNLSTKGKKGLLQLHKTVQEDLKDRSSLKVYNYQENQKPDSDTMLSSEKENTQMEKMQKEMNAMKLKNEMSSEILEPSSLKGFLLSRWIKKNLLMPNRKRIMIRSRL